MHKTVIHVLRCACVALLSTAALQAQATPAFQTYIKASNAEAGDAFGLRIALSGDFMAVGAYGEDGASASNPHDNQAPASGAVYIYRRNGGSWLEEARIKAPNPGAGDNFGYSVALSDGLLAVGGLLEDGSATAVDGPYDDNAPDAGAAYVYRRRIGASGPEWSFEAYVKAPNAEAGDRFGYSIALDGDTLAVGAYQEGGGAGGVDAPGALGDNSRPDSGAVYTFRRNAGGQGPRWRFDSYIKAPHPDAADRFGWDVHLSGDSLAISAVGESSSSAGVGGNQLDNAMFYSGAVYIYRRGVVAGGPRWEFEAYLKASNPDALDTFGWAIDMQGDLLAVGACQEDGGGNGPGADQTDNGSADSGCVYIFQRTQVGGAAVWTQRAYLKASNTGANDRFGNEVRIDGNMVAVAAMWEDGASHGVGGNQASNAAPESGAVYLFRKNGTSWLQTAYIKPTNTHAGERFGFGLDFADGTLLVGAPGESGASSGIDGNQSSLGAPDSGAVYHCTLLVDDCNLNGVPDALDIAAGAPDCDANGAIDACQIADGLSGDADFDGVPDQCEGAAVTYCFGDGSDGPCPCGLPGGIGRGCASRPNAAGARLAASGVASRTTDTLRLQVEGVALGHRIVLWEGTQAAPATPFYGGLDCLGGWLGRVSAGFADENGMSVPAAGAGPLHTMTWMTIHAGTWRHYQARYWEWVPGFGNCKVNTTNALRVLWTP